MTQLFKIFIVTLLITSLPCIAQNKKTEALKRQAILLMQAGRFGEAIDQLHKYITANPREADGYHKRGLCYEQRTEYQYSVLDLRRALNLDPTNREIQKDLNRVIAIWHKQLYAKIEGHKRDIAIDPNYAFSYLEIGKSYRWLEEWSNAEIWYDEYLKRDDNASPDEIIRYTEILAKTGSIIKGEKILKKYTERYPDDWRIWSRYGYFVLWLGKYKVAEDAFKTSLGFKPFFKEAEDGLDLAKRQGYLTQYIPRAFERVEYPIDRYYRILDKDPENDQARFNLINELITANRVEEAYQQLQYLQPKHADEENFKTLWKSVTENRDSTFTKNVEYYTGVLKNNPSDKNAVLKLSEAYANQLYYDSALEVLNEYLQNVPESEDFDVRFKLAQYSAWNYEWEKAIAQIEKLIEYDPNNLDYQLLRGQIAVWTVHDLDVGEKYLLNVLDVRPRDLNTLISLVSLYSWQRKFIEAKKYLDLAKSIAPRNSEVQNAQSNYEIHMTAYQEQKVFTMKDEAAKLAMEGKCDEALAVYENYKSKRTGLTRDEKIEYAQIASYAKEFDKAIQIYDQLLDEQYDYSVAVQRAKNYYYNKDSTKALTELETLSIINPDDFDARITLADAYAMTNQLSNAEELYRELRSNTKDEKEIEQIDRKMIYLGEYYIKEKNYDKAEEILDEMETKISDSNLVKELNLRRLYLGDAYVMDEKYGSAKSVYKNLLSVVKDTSEQRMIKERMSWLPATGFSGGLLGIGNLFSFILPTNLGLSPFSTYYKDNQQFQLWNYGLRLDGGFFGFLSLGGVWSRINIYNSIINYNFIQMKGTAAFSLMKNIYLSGSYGLLRYENEPERKIGDIMLRWDIKENFYIALSLENTDTRIILYSPNLMNTRYTIDYVRLNSTYTYNNMFRIALLYNYFNNSDSNEGNDFQVRLGKMFLPHTYFGYEYYYSDYGFISPLYYSPQEFTSHSLWGEIDWQYENWKLKAGGKLGYVPSVDFILSEIFGEATYKPLPNFNISLRLGYGNSFRYDSSYKSFSTSIFAYWEIY